MRKQTALPTLWIAHSGTIDALIEGIVGHGAANLEADSTYGQCLVIDRPPSDPWLGLALRAFNVDLPNAINFSKRIVT